MKDNASRQPNRRASCLAGLWGDPLRLSDIRYEFKQLKSGWRVRCYDVADGEESKVSRVKLEGHTLSFEIYSRSTDYRTINSMRPLSKTKVVHTLTHWETWLKYGPWLLGKPTPRERKANWIYGDWFDPEWWCRNAISVMRMHNDRISVGMGRDIDVSRVFWDETTLKFLSYAPEYTPKRLCYTYHALQPLSDTKASHEITEDWELIRYE